MKKTISLALFLCCLNLNAQKKAELASPNGHIKVSVDITDEIYYSVTHGNDLLLKNNYLGLSLKGETIGSKPQLSGQKNSKGNEILEPVIPLKFSKVSNVYNQLTLTFKGNYSVEFRAYDDGVAYRLITNKKNEIEVLHEDFAVNFPSDYLLHLQQTGGFKTAYEEPYTHIESKSWKQGDKMSVLPILIDTKRDYKILISETDISNYPRMFLKGNGNNGVESVFPKTPTEFGDDGDRSVKLLKEADYITKTAGQRSFPWRYFVITKDDKQLLETTLPYKLAPKSVIKDPSWIKPGQVSWEWWNDASPYGDDVNFVAGYNLDTYKYYIDFASKYGIESIPS